MELFSDSELTAAPSPDRSRSDPHAHVVHLELEIRAKTKEIVSSLAEDLGPDNGTLLRRFDSTVRTGRQESKIGYSEQSDKIRITIPEAACKVVGTRRIIHWLRNLHHNGVVASARRIELARDDRQRLYTPKDVADRIWQQTPLPSGSVQGAWKKGVRTAARRCSRFTPNADYVDGGSICIGSPNSHRMLFIHETCTDSDCAVDSVRWQLRGVHEWADAYVEAIRDAHDIDTMFKGLLLDIIDINVPQSYSRHRQSRTRARWYRRIVGATKRANVSPKVTVRSAVDIVEHTKMQIQRRMAFLYRAYGDNPDAIAERIRDGLEKLTAEDERIAGEYRASHVVTIA